MTQVNAAYTSHLLPRRLPDTSKGDYGKAFLLCGSEGLAGAARLAAEGCLRAGAGLVCLGTPRSVYPILAAACPPEIMCFPLPEDEYGRLSSEALPAIRKRLDWCDAMLIGPGLGQSKALTRLVRLLCNRRKKPLVVDADGLNALAGHILVQHPAPLFFTPHDGEFFRLGGDAADPNRAEATRRLAARTRAILVRKGHQTLTVSPLGTVYINTSGNPGMAKGGSGDVLAGFLTGLAAQKAAGPAWEALDWAQLAACAVFWHGRAGDLCAEELGEYGMTPSDLAGMLPKSMKSEE